MDKAKLQMKNPMMGRLSDPFKQCGKSVFILGRLNVGGKILHRTCFKCARCQDQLTLASYYETETGQFCCEVCPGVERYGHHNEVVCSLGYWKSDRKTANRLGW